MMNSITIKSLLFAVILSISGISCMADDYVVVAKSGKVYDDPSPKYVTLNQLNEDVNVIPGMVFKTYEHTPGWYMVEYSPGLRAYIPEQIVASSFNSPKSGDYKVQNNPSQSASVQNSGNDWSMNISGKSYDGKLQENVVIFFDESGNIAYSLVDLGQGGIVITYNNDVTKFF